MTAPEKLSRSDVIALEKSYWEAMKAKDGGKTAELTGKNSLVTGPQGIRAIPKDQMGKMTEEGDWKLHEYAMDDIEVWQPADNVAIVAYRVRQKVTMGGKTQEIRAADCSTWVHGSNGWECHAHSETILPKS
ncbi:MAG: nuclear transport factor 2 family protein [Rhodobiaceae bacterium]|nr:nuclear transport factor 2 family protein [Rhodobiaceae bacterium]MCC0056047.1 nuclear transport factor 2 family protein [Rhodobiaceae bacterium]